MSGFYKSRKKGGLFAITQRSKKRGGVEKVNLENSFLEVQTENKEIVDFGANINKNLISDDSNFFEFKFLFGWKNQGIYGDLLNSKISKINRELRKFDTPGSVINEGCVNQN